MADIELGRHTEITSRIVANCEAQLREVMRLFYRDLSEHLKGDHDDLPKWVAKKGRWRIITFPGSPRDTAIALKPDGGFEYMQWGISRSPNEFDPPITSLKYFEVAMQTLGRVEVHN